MRPLVRPSGAVQIPWAPAVVFYTAVVGGGRFRFGVVCTGGYSSTEWTELARKVEDSGFSTLLVADHYMNPMSCGPLMMAAAAATSTLRIGSYVYNNDFRPPALLAKEAATIDVLSGGRFELGIGAGWLREEYVAAGVHFDEPKVRAERFEEAVGIIRRLLAGESVEHRGTHYRLRGLEGMPKPVQQPLPLLLGCGGPRMTRFAAGAADIVAFVPQSLPQGGLDPHALSEAALADRVARLESALVGGREPERSVLLFGIGRNADSVRERFEGLDADDVARSPYALIGDRAAMVDALLERRERWGLSYLVCFDDQLDEFLGVADALA